MSFASLGLSEPLVRTVAAEGYTTPTPIQLAAIPHVLAGRDLLGCAQTGTGKTAAFALPVLDRLAKAAAHAPRRPGLARVLVLAPTRELAAQIGESFTVYGRRTGLKNTVIFGGVGQRPQVEAVKRGVDVLVATPGRLLDLMGQGYVHLDGVEVLILDEADRMFDMGFLPDVRRIVARVPARRQTLLFSATMPGPVEELARGLLRDPAQVKIAPERPATEAVEQFVAFVPKAAKPRVLADWITHHALERAIAFTRTKHGADRLAKQLARAGIAAEAIHGNKRQNARQRTLEAFKTGRIRVLVATDVAARGLDVDGISHVFNFELPHEPETYVHRIGRTGRAGATGIAVSLCDPSERSYLKAIERLVGRPLAVERIALDGVDLTAAPAGHDDARPPRRESGRKPGRKPPAAHGQPAAAGQKRRRKLAAAHGSTGAHGRGTTGSGHKAHGRRSGQAQQGHAAHAHGDGQERTTGPAAGTDAHAARRQRRRRSAYALGK